jgi:zinc and cadmium transporter
MNLLFWIYCLLIVLVSMAGGAVPMIVRLTHRRLQLATSLIAGFLLGVALLTLLPHALLAVPVATAMGWVVVGLMVMFFLERLFAYHHHLAPGEAGMPPVTADPEPLAEADCDAEPGDPLDHHHGHPLPPKPNAERHEASDHTHDHHHHPPTELSWLGITLGLVIHSLIGGIALGAAVSAEDLIHTEHAGAWLPALPGVAVFLGIFLHKPFDALTLLTMLRTTNRSRFTQHLINFLFALCTPLGGVLFFWGLAGVDLAHSTVVGCALAFAAGVFLCVALADLLPEVHFHRHDRGALSLAVLAGLGLAWAIAIMEAQTHDHDQHDHSHEPPAVRTDDPHDHHGNDHDHTHDHDHAAPDPDEADAPGHPHDADTHDHHDH